MSNRIDTSSATTEFVLPNGPALLGMYNSHVVGNFRAGAAASAQLLSTFRMAKLLTGEAAPLIVYSYGNLP